MSHLSPKIYVLVCVVVSSLCQLDCPDILSYIFLGVSVRMLLDEINILSCTNMWVLGGEGLFN
jgi:hypothetical protein